MPALTLADAAFGALRIARQRYAILVPAPGFESVIGRLPALYGAEGLCTGLAAVSVPPQDPHYAEAAEKALINLVRSASPEAVLAVGPPLTPHLDRLASVCPVPLIEGVACAVEMLRATVNLRLGSRRSTEAVAALAPASIGLSAELASRLKG